MSTTGVLIYAWVLKAQRNSIALAGISTRPARSFGSNCGTTARLSKPTPDLLGASKRLQGSGPLLLHPFPYRLPKDIVSVDIQEPAQRWRYVKMSQIISPTTGPISDLRRNSGRQRTSYADTWT